MTKRREFVPQIKAVKRLQRAVTLFWDALRIRNVFVYKELVEGVQIDSHHPVNLRLKDVISRIQRCWREEP